MALSSRKKENPNDCWTAPEHGKLTRDRKRDYPRDDFGRRIPGMGRVLVIDPRPEILRVRTQ